MLGALLGAGAGAAGLFLLSGRYWAARYRPPDEFRELRYAETADGWRIALIHYPPEQPRAGQAPVVLCHGLGATRHNLDLDERHSVARYLAGRGLDAWVVELRGRGLSARAHQSERARRDWSFDDYVLHDGPAVIDEVRRLTGAAAVHWVGHSMGGMIAYALLQGPAADRLRSCVTLGSPWAFPHRVKARFLCYLRPLLMIPPHTGQQALMRAYAPFVPRWGLPVVSEGWNVHNMSRQTARRVLTHVLTNIHRGEIDQVLDWITVGEMRTRDRSRSYSAGLDRITRPVLFIAGAVDPLAPPALIEAGARRLQAAGSGYRLMGRATGCRVDYGHGDLILGRDAPDEVFPVIADWIEGH